MSNAVAKASPAQTGTELAVVEASRYIKDSEYAVVEAMQENMLDGEGFRESDLTRVKTPSGGATTWMIPTLSGDVATSVVEGVIVHVAVRGVLWENDEPMEGTLPALVTNDLKTARLVSSDLSKAFIESIAGAHLGGKAYDWTKLPQNEFGTGKGGSGKAAKEQRLLFVKTAYEAMPLLVTVQPGSLENWREFRNRLTKAGLPYWKVGVSIGLEKAKSEGGINYAKVTFAVAGLLPEEKAVEIHEKYGSAMATIAAQSFAS